MDIPNWDLGPIEETCPETILASSSSTDNDLNSSKLKKRSLNVDNKKSFNHITSKSSPVSVLNKTESPFKSPSLLSFDAYGNLTLSDEADTSCVEIPSLAEFDYILDSFEGKLKSSAAKSLPVKKRKHVKNKKISEKKSPLSTLADKNLTKIFKKDYDANAGVTSRYGRARKQKSQDGFMFGTINFNELRKIATSPKKTRLSSSSENTNGFETPESDLSKNFDLLSSKISGYSSEEEFENTSSQKKQKVARSKTLPANLSNVKSDISRKLSSKSETSTKQLSLKKKSEKAKSNKDIVKTKGNKNNKKLKKNNSLSRINTNIENEKATKIKNVKQNLKGKNMRSTENGTLPPNINIDKGSKFKKTMRSGKKTLLNKSIESHENNTDQLSISLPDVLDNLKHNEIDEEQSYLKEEPQIGTIQDELNIIKSSLMTKNEIVLPSKELPDSIMQGSTDEEQSFSENESQPKEECKVNPQIIQMETLNDEVKSEDLPKTKFGRQVRKPDLIDLSSHSKSRKSFEPKTSLNANLDDTSKLEDCKQLEKTHPIQYFIGDLVWVLMKGNPMWPGMITYPKNESEYSRMVKSTGIIAGKVRQYHVHFFCDNYQTCWVPGTRLLVYDGLQKLKEYVENMKESAKLDKHYMRDYVRKNIMKNFTRLFSFMQKDKTIHAKTWHWHSAVEEADQAKRINRYQRIELFRPDEEKRVDISVVKKRKYNRIRKDSKDETSSNRSKSSDDFSGFDEDSSSEKRKIKRMKLESTLPTGDFNVYLQKHLNSSVNDLHMSEERAKKLLEKRWSKLTLLQKSRYRSKTNYSSNSDESESTSSSTSSRTKSRKSSFDDGVDIAKGTYRILKNEKVCFHCEGVSDKNGLDMVRCKGVCNGFFHLKCVGMTSLPKTDFKCAFCLSGVHNCFICKSSEGQKVKCSINNCGKFYHSDCANQWPQVSKSRQTEKLVCPRHLCHMCAGHADDMNDTVARTPPFSRCLRCPTAYHTAETCVAASSEEISQGFLICPKHFEPPNNNVHHFNVNWCFCCSKGGSLLLCDQCPAAFHADCLNITAPEGSYVCDDCQNGVFPSFGDIVWVKLGCYRWWPGEVLHPRHIPDNIENLKHTPGMFCVHFFGSDDYYWVYRGRTFHYQEGDKGSKYTSSKFLQQKFQKALEEALIAFHKQKERREKQEQSLSQKGSLKPAPYVKLDTNKPVGNVKLGKLDISTVNKCDCDPFSDNPCGSDDKCINRMLMVECIKEVCPAKERCHNQRFQRRLYPHVYIFKTSGRGWGLKTKDFIKKGDFVIEYVGELIDDAELHRRIDKMHEYKEENYYFLTVEPDRVIDAGPKGNLARFMNHCCRPNCETQKWTVGADTRVGLFALEDIPEGSEVTFNYNLLCVGTDKKKCNCQAPNCSGYIGAKIQKSEANLSKKNKLEGATKKKRIRKKRRTKPKNWENECFRCSGGGNLILCDRNCCPKGYHLRCLGLKELPKGKWLCPWHHCDDCGLRSVNRCVLCPNSYCRIHSEDKFHATDLTVCLEHNDEELETRSEGSGSSTSRSSDFDPDYDG